MIDIRFEISLNKVERLVELANWVADFLAEENGKISKSEEDTLMYDLQIFLELINDYTPDDFQLKKILKKKIHQADVKIYGGQKAKKSD